MKVLIYWPYFQHYHWARTRALSDLCARQSIAFLALALSRRSNDLHSAVQAEDYGGQVIYLDEYKGEMGASKFSDAAVLDKFLNDFQPDVICVNGYAEPLARLLSFYAARKDIAAVLMSDSKFNDATRLWHKEWVKRQLVSCFSSALVASSHASNYAESLGIPKESHFAPYDVVDNDFWFSAREDAERDYILSIGRFVTKKNFDFLIRAYGKLHSQSEEEVPKLRIVGDGPEKEKLLRVISELGLSEMVSVEPYKEPERLKELYANAQFFVLASNQEEQWGLVVNEAIAAGLSVVVSNQVGCVPDLVENRITGLTFALDSLDDCVNAMKFALTECEEMKALRQAAQVRIGCFSCANFAEAALSAARYGYNRRSAKPWNFVQAIVAFQDRRRFRIPVNPES